MVISAMNFKGGAGKTMICTNLAAAYAQQGRAVCIVDTDESRAASKWASRRADIEGLAHISIVQITEPKTIVATVRKLDQDNDLVIIDGPPRLNALVGKVTLLSDLVIIPVPPKGGNDWEVTEDFLRRFNEIQEQRPDGGRTEAYLLPNMVKQGYNLHTAFIGSMPEMCTDFGVKMFKTQISDLVAYGEANQFGYGISEYQTTSKAKTQFDDLLQEIHKVLY